MSSPHALVLPQPFLGHITPLMHLSHFLSNHGFKITFVNTEQNQNIISANHENMFDQIRAISISDGLPPEENRLTYKLFLSMEKNMPMQSEQVIQEINEKEEEKITIFIVDCGMAWTFEVAEKMGLQVVAFCAASGAHLAVSYLSIPKLMEDGVIDENGLPKNKEQFRLITTTAPFMDQTQFTWNYVEDDREAQKLFFHFFLGNNKALSKARFILSNSCEELELPIFKSFPNILPVGPLPIEQDEKNGIQIGHFPEDTTCMTWLDQQQTYSVVYISFGSLAKLDQNQFQEVALGLELSQTRFLWITRPDLTDGDNDVFIRQFHERVKERGKIVAWFNQMNVLAQPSVACFVSHCGWNSTLEGVKNGLRFLCWPLFGDQFANQNYICDELNIGLRLVKNENGIVTKEHIRSSLIELIKNQAMKAKAQKLKKIVNKSSAEGGSSFTNLRKFTEAMEQ